MQIAGVVCLSSAEYIGYQGTALAHTVPFPCAEPPDDRSGGSHLEVHQHMARREGRRARSSLSPYLPGCCKAYTADWHLASTRARLHMATAVYARKKRLGIHMSRGMFTTTGRDLRDDGRRSCAHFCSIKAGGQGDQVQGVPRVSVLPERGWVTQTLALLSPYAHYGGHIGLERPIF